MSEGLNRAQLLGTLGADPELRYTQGGMSILKLRLATNERVKKGDEWHEHAEWHDVTVIGKRAEGLSKCLVKGSSVMVEGPLRTSSWEKDGVKRYRTEVIADRVYLTGGRRADGGGEERPQRDETRRSSRRGAPKDEPNDGWNDPGDGNGDDIPF